MKPCRILYYCYENNPLNCEVDPHQNGQQAGILDFRCAALVAYMMVYAFRY